MTLVNPPWQQRDVYLQFQLGEFRLKQVAFRGMVANDGTALEAGPPRPGRVADHSIPALPTGIDVALILSCPTFSLRTGNEPFGHVFRYVPNNYERLYVDLSGTFADYVKTFQGKSGYTLRKKLGRFKAISGGTIRWREYRLPADMAAFHSLARAISPTTHQERHLHRGIPAHQPFLDELRRLAAEDSVRGYVLSLGDEPIAYMHCTAADEGLLCGYVGYNPKYKALSPGVVLLYVLLERLFSERRFRFLDFGWGGSQHKRLFATRCVPCSDLYYFRRTHRNVAIVKLHSLLESLTTRTAGTLQALGVKSQVKRLLAGSSDES